VDSLRDKFKKQFYAGIGRPADTLSNLPRSYQEASLAQLVCPAVGEGNYVLSYDQCGIFRLLHLQVHSPEAQKYLEDYILPIVEWDKNYQEELFRTLEVWVECRGNIRMAARKLYLHHNSIRYRINKIEKILGCDLKNPQNWITVSAGIMLYRLATKCQYNSVSKSNSKQ
jgi:purine catabolism regulator